MEEKLAQELYVLYYYTKTSGVLLTRRLSGVGTLPWMVTASCTLCHVLSLEMGILVS